MFKKLFSRYIPEDKIDSMIERHEHHEVILRKQKSLEVIALIDQLEREEEMKPVTPIDSVRHNILN